MSKVNVKPGSIEEATVDEGALAAMDNSGGQVATAADGFASASEIEFLKSLNRISYDYLHIGYSVASGFPDGTPEGGIYLGKGWDCCVADPGKTVKAVVIGHPRMYWKQYSWDPASGQLPKKYATKAEALAAGETVEWVGTGPTAVKPTCAPALDIAMLIARPEGCDDPRFAYAIGDGLYAPAIFTADKAHYKPVEEFIRRAFQHEANVSRATDLSKVYLHGMWVGLSIVKEVSKSGRNLRKARLGYYVDPKEHKVVLMTEEEKAAIRDIVAGNLEEAPVEAE